MLELTGDQGIEFRRMRHVPFGVIAESVPNPTLRIVPEPCRRFRDGGEFMDEVSGRIFG